ncbi:unnamed protein product [Sphagnum tenellum]
MQKIIFSVLAAFVLPYLVAAVPAPQDDDCQPTPPPTCESSTSSAPLGVSSGTAQSGCTHGDYTCIGNDSAVCNWGQWVVTTCGDGMRCLPYDWECVPVSDYDSLVQEVTPQTASSS